MPRKPNTVRPVSLKTSIPEDLYTKLTLHLFSDLEGRVPMGAYQKFICERIREFFARPQNATQILLTRPLTAEDIIILENCVDKAASWKGGVDPIDIPAAEFAIEYARKILSQLQEEVK